MKQSNKLALKQIKITKYKVLQNFEISFMDKNQNILDTIVIAGINGSGKTALLELIQNCCSFVFENDEDFIETNTIKFHKNRKGKNFLSKEDKNKHCEEFKSNFVYLKVFENQKELVVSKIKDFLDYIREQNEDLTIKESNQKLADEINNIFADIELQTKFKGVSKDIKREIIFENELNNSIKLDELSTGEQQLFIRALSLKMMDIKNKVILIDEPEISLHPNWQNYILKIYQNIAKEGNNQLIVATHSPQIVASTPNESLRVMIKDGNNTKVKSYDNSYGAEIEEVLQDIMGTQYLRTPSIAKDILMMWEYLNNEDIDNFDKYYDKLSKILDINDKDLVLARLKKSKIIGIKNDKC